MKVIQINRSVNKGSTGRITEEIGKKLIANGHESVIAYSTAGPAGSESKLIKIGSPFDVYLHGLKTRILDAHGFGSTKATEKFIHDLDREDPDLIGLHNLHGYYLNVELLFNYLKTVQKPIIWTLHDCWPFTGHCSFFDYVSCEKWMTECNNCPLYNKYPASLWIDNSKDNFYRKKDLFNGLDNLTIVTPSNWLKNLVSKSFLSDYPVEMIHNGIDIEQFAPVDGGNLRSKYGLVGKIILLGVASVWDRRKGFDYFTELSEILDDQYKIVLIGLSKNEIEKLPPNIIGIQRTENIEELVSFYSMADIFLNPTLVDNFPTTNLEALACGTPVITFNTGGSPEAIDEQTGTVVKKGDLNHLHNAVTIMAKKTGSQISAACRERAEKLYNKEDRFDDYLQLYLRSYEQSYKMV